MKSALSRNNICLKDIFLVFLSSEEKREMQEESQRNRTANNRRFSRIDIYKRNGIASIPSFARQILPMDFYLVLKSSVSAEKVLQSDAEEKDALFKEVRSDTSNTTLSRVFNNINSASNRMKEIITLLTQVTASGYTSYENCTYRAQLISRWNSVLNGASAEERAAIEENITGLIDRFPDNTSNHVRSRLQIARSSGNAEVLACLTLIACTACVWEGSDNSGNALLVPDIVLPPLPGKDSISPNREILEDNAQTARKILNKISYEKGFVEKFANCAKLCYESCLKILAIQPLGDVKILGETNFILYKCCQNPDFVPADGASADYYLAQSQKYHYTAAFSVTPENLSLYESPPRGKSSRFGIAVFNETNTFSDIFVQSLPQGWTPQLFNDADFRPDHSAAYKYLLCSEKGYKNIADLLKILDYYKQNSDTGIDVEVFILEQEEVLADIIDTAQQYMESRVIPIHIIDIDRLSAQYLLARHPLFYPIINYPSVPSILNFVIFGTDRCAEYLVRTAFWMMTFTDHLVTPKITVIGQDAGRFVKRILCECPGLRADIALKYPVLEDFGYDISPVNVPDIHSEEFDRVFEALMSSGHYLYFAVTSPDDMKNLALATDLREKLIRYYIHTGKSWLLKNPPPIAFRCTDFNIASMSRRLVVGSINHGTAWYNNYSIFPFGCYASDLFNWDSLVGNPIEHVARCVALVYGNVRLPAVREDFTEKKRAELENMLQDYYGKQYNKSSSFAVSLSLPYRLFNCMIHRRRIIPESWDIGNRDAFYNYKVLSYFAEKLKPMTLPGAPVKSCGQWEHERWVRWCLSEKWLPSGTEDIHFYQKEGAPKHQLHIARLHPCICRNEELPALEKELQKDFHSFDENTILMARDILLGAVAWHDAEAEDSSKSDTGN